METGSILYLTFEDSEFPGFSPDSRFIAVSFRRGRRTLAVELATQRTLNIFEVTEEEDLYDVLVLFSPRDTPNRACVRAISARTPLLSMWDISTGQQMWTLGVGLGRSVLDSIAPLLFAPDGRMICCWHDTKDGE